MNLLGISGDSDSFRRIDWRRHVELPVPPHCGSFAFVRAHHTHEGVDLYAAEGTPVAAMEDGIVVRIEDFTGPSVGMPWWRDTQAVLVEGDRHLLCYGEITPRPELTAGATVRAGDILGHVATVLTEDKGRPMSMLHLEAYERGYRGPTADWVPPGAPRPAGLLDPTELLRPLFQGAPS